MSTSIDQKVVEMRFDNKQFEANVKESMSTIEKLKEKLKFKDSAKGLEQVSEAANKCDMSKMTSAVETVQAKFSAMEVVAVTALANITNSVINTGKQMIRSLSVDQISSGWAKYGSKTSSVATLVAQGNALEDVNAQLDRLNWFTDETSYNFTDMVSNIAKFTASGKGLNESVTAMEGIANWAALSGQNAATASRAMYQLSQAMGAGVMRKEDYKSIQTASMDTDEFRQKALDAGVALGKLKKNADGTYRSLVAVSKAGAESFTKSQFAEKLTQGAWFTSDVMMKVFQDYSAAVDQIYEYADEKGITASKAIEELGDKVDSFGLKAFKAAQEARTWGDAVDSVKDAVSTGWMKTFELIFGDQKEATRLWTDLANKMYDIFAAPGDTRNKLLEEALSSSPWEKFIAKVNDAGISTEDFQKALIETGKTHGKVTDELISKAGSFEASLSQGWLSSDIVIETLDKMSAAEGGLSAATSDVTKKLEYFQDVVDKVWHGDYKNGRARVEALTKAGYDYAEVQALVNKTVDGHRLTLEDLSGSQLKAVGYTEEEIAAIRDLADEARTAGTDINGLIRSLNKANGRTLLLDSFKNAAAGVERAIASIAKAWRSVFPATTSDRIYSAIEALNQFSQRLIMSDETAANITRTFRGLFSMLDLVRVLVSGALNAAFRLIGELLGMADVNVLQLTGSMGDMLVQFHDWVLENDRIVTGLNKFVDVVIRSIREFRTWTKESEKFRSFTRVLAEFQNGVSESLGKAGEYLSKGSDGLSEFIQRTKELDGLSFGNVMRTLADFKDNVLTSFVDASEDLSKVKGSVDGLKDSVKQGVTEAGNSFVWLQNKVLETAVSIRTAIDKNINTIFTVALGAGLAVGIKALGDGLTKLAGVVPNLNTVFNALSSTLLTYQKQIKVNALLKIAGAIGILAASVAVLSMMDTAKVLISVGVIAALAASLAVLSTALSKVDTTKGTAKLTSIIGGLSVSMLIMAKAMKSLEGLNPETLTRNLLVMIALCGTLAVAITALGKGAPAFSVKATALLAMSASLVMMAKALKAMETLDSTKLVSSITALAACVAGMVVLLNLYAKLGRVGKTSIGAVSVLVSIAALKLFADSLQKIAEIDTVTIGASLRSFVVVFGLFAVMMAASSKAGKYAAKGGVAIIAMSAAIAILGVAMKGLSTIGNHDLNRTAAVISGLLVVFAGVVALSKFAGANAAKAGGMLMQMSVALAVLSGVMAVLSFVDPDRLTRVAVIVGGLVALFGGVVAATKLAQDSTASIAIIAGSITLLAGAMIAMTFLDPEKLKNAAVCLTLLMGAFSVLAIVGRFAGKASSSMLTLVGVVVLLGGVLGMLSTLPVESALPMAKSMSILLLALSGSCLILSGVGTLGYAAAAGAKTMLALMGIMGVLMTAIGALVTYVPAVEKFMDKGLGCLEKIGYAIGSFFGNMIGGFSSGATSGLPAIGENLAKFMENAEPFFTITGSINEGAIDGAKTIADTIKTLADAQVARNLLGENGTAGSLADFGKEMLDFAGYFKDYAIKMNEIENLDVVQASANAARSLAQFAAEIPNAGGLAAKVVGENSIVDFGEAIANFAPNFVTYANEISKISDFSIVSASAVAAQSIAEFAAKVPNAGGLVAKVTGENNIIDFGKAIKDFAPNFVSYAKDISQISDFGIVEASTAAATTIAEFAAKIPNDGGLVGKVTGDNNIADFGEALAAFAPKFKEYIENVSGITLSDVEASTAAAQCLADFAKIVPETGGLLEFFIGNRGLSNFGENLTEFGGSLKTYADTMASTNLSAVESATKAVKGLMDELNSFEAGSHLLASFNTTMTLIGQAGATYIATGFKNSGEFAKEAQGMITRAAETIRNKTNWDAFKEAGYYFVDGFVQGILGSAYLAVNAVDSLGAQVIDAFNRKLDIHSPSKEGEKSGSFWSEGVAKGIEKVKAVKEAATNKAGEVLTSFSNGLMNSNLMESTINIKMGNVADGITKNMSLEDAMAKKAKNIADAFKKELDKVDLDITTRDLEYQLWEQSNSDASDAEKAVANIEMLASKIELQAKNVETAKAEYQATLKELGDHAEETQEAYNKLLNEQIELAKLSSELAEAQKTEQERQRSVQESNEQAFRSYLKWMTENKQALLDMGFELSRIEAYARKETGYDPAVGMPSNGFLDSFKTVGEDCADAVGDGIQNESQNVADTAAGMADSCANELRSKYDQFFETGKTLGIGLRQGMQASTVGSVLGGSLLAGIAVSRTRKQSGTVTKVDSTDALKTARLLAAAEARTTTGLRTRTTLSSAQAVSEARKSQAQGQSGAMAPAAKGNSYSFVQNNYSPKALSNMEIYRQTKNQFAAMKEATKI